MVLYLGWFWLLLEARGRSSLGPRCLLMVMSLIPPAPGPSYLRRQPKKVCLNNSSDMGGQRKSPSLGNLLKNLLILMSLTTPESGTRQGLRSKPGVLCVPGTLLLCRFVQAARLNGQRAGPRCPKMVLRCSPLIYCSADWPRLEHTLPPRSFHTTL